MFEIVSKEADSISINFLHRHSLREVLDAPNVMNMIKDTKAAKEVV